MRSGRQAKAAPASFYISLVDAALLLVAITKAAREIEGGWGHAHVPLSRLMSALELKDVKISRRTLECALWSAAQLEEEGSLSQLTDEPLGMLIYRLLKEGGHRGATYNWDYHLITLRKEKPSKNGVRR
jgi:hypothetical protein